MTPALSSARLPSDQRDESPLFGRLAGRLRRFMALRRTRRQLRDLDDYMLRDIGLTRGDIALPGSDDWLQRNRR